MNKNRIAELEKQLDDIKSEIEKLKAEESQVKPWRAQYDTPYYVLDVCHEVNTVLDWRGNFDDKRYYCGNYYRNKELAEQDAKELTLRGKTRQLKDIFCEGFICGSIMYSIYYDVKNEVYTPFECSGTKIVGSIVFNTLINAQMACDILNAELKSQ